MLRSSNLIAKSLTDVDLKMVLTWEDVSPLHNSLENGFLISVPKSKNNQFGDRIHEIPLATAADSSLRPVKAIMGLINTYGRDHCYGNKPVFQIPDAHGKLAPVVRHKYDFWFKTRLRNMGLDPSLYTLHGFRHAGIQECLLAEGNLALCKLSPDHSSDAILEYSHIPADRRLKISTKVDRSLASAVASSPSIASRPLDAPLLISV
jgi:hypothetical protein